MSQKKETIILVLSLIITLGFVGVGFRWFTGQYKFSNQEKPSQSTSTNQSSEPSISWGNKTLISGEVNPEKQAGIEAIANGNFSQAISNLESYLRQNRNDPEAVIFLNNARIGTKKSYTIAVSIPIGTDPNGALEIMRGVAQAQNEIARDGGIKGVSLKIAIANDDNNPETAKQVAAELAKNPEVLGVVGPYSSDATLAAGTIYQAGKLVAISPVSTSVKLSNFSPYIFRTVPSDYISARALADYMLTKLKAKNAAVFFNSQSSYSQSLKSEFVTAVSLGGGQISGEFDLSSPDFNAVKSVEQAIRQGAQVLMLAANTGTLDKALQVVRVNRKRLKLMGGDDVYAPKTLEIGAEDAVEMTIAVPWHIDADPKSSFSQQSRKLWGGDVNWRTALAYDAVKALGVAIDRNPSRTGVQQALSASDFSSTGASGVIRFLPSGDRNANIQLVKIVPGKRSGIGYDFVPLLPQR